MIVLCLLPVDVSFQRGANRGLRFLHARGGDLTRDALLNPPSHGFVFVAGKGEHGPGDIAVHTKSVLDQLEAELKKAGSSMEKVLKVNVYLHDMRDFEGMNAVYRGRFGAKPPVRTTIAAFGGIPGQSLVEMDCIAAL